MTLQGSQYQFDNLIQYLKIRGQFQKRIKAPDNNDPLQNGKLARLFGKNGNVNDEQKRFSPLLY